MVSGLPALADNTLRVATFNVGLDRAGPGILLRDILRKDDDKIQMIRDVIAAVAPDILLLTNFDYDYDLRALSAFADQLDVIGATYPYLFALAPNSGQSTGLDLNGDGRLGTPDDAQGYGEFAGQGGMALLSKFPIDKANIRDFSHILWKDIPGGELPVWPRNKKQAERAMDVQRLSSVGHWDVPVSMPDGGVLHLLAYHATTPAFDGPEDRNGLRNHDENTFWLSYLAGELDWLPPNGPFVLLGDSNLDPTDGDGKRRTMAALLGQPMFQDPMPTSRGAAEASRLQGDKNNSHRGDPALDTADWNDDFGPGNLRVDYVLPSNGLEIQDAGVFWPASDEADFNLLKNRDPAVSWHGLVWVDIRR